MLVRYGHQAGLCCAAVLQELSLVTSVGIASNKMVAKLASQASKPDGILVVDGPAALQSLLKATPAARLPRCGGKVTDTLVRAGIHTVADLQVRVLLGPILACRAAHLIQHLAQPTA